MARVLAPVPLEVVAREVVHDRVVDVRACGARHDRRERRFPRSQHVVEEPAHPVGRRPDDERALELRLVAPDRRARLGDEHVAGLELDVVRDRVRPRAPRPDLAAEAAFTPSPEPSSPREPCAASIASVVSCCARRLASASVDADARVLLEQPVRVRAPAAALAYQLDLGRALADEHLLDLVGERASPTRR